MLRRSLIGLVLAFAVVFPTRAGADCASSLLPNYGITVSGNTVTIALDQTQRTCPDANGMLRQNTVTGEVDLLADYCGKVMYHHTLDDAYVDECVPPGTYRYGLALPFECDKHGCGGGEVDIYKEITVAAPLDPGCARSPGDPGPIVTNEIPPWGTGAEPVRYQSCPVTSCFCNTTSASVVSMNAGALALGIAAMIAARARRRRA